MEAEDVGTADGRLKHAALGVHGAAGIGRALAEGKILPIVYFYIVQINRFNDIVLLLRQKLRMFNLSSISIVSIYLFKVCQV